MGFEALFDQVVEETIPIRGGKRLIVGFTPEAGTARDSDSLDREDIDSLCEYLAKHMKYWRLETQGDNDGELPELNANNLASQTPETVVIALTYKLEELKNSITGKSKKHKR